MPVNVLCVISSSKTLAEFLLGDSLKSEFKAIGGVEMDAATLALSNISNSDDPKRDLTLAIGHLQSAHIAFRKAWETRNSVVGKTIQFWALLDYQSKDMMVCALIAMCYSYLGAK